MPKQRRYDFPMPVSMLSAGVAASVAEVITIPLDTAKVRLQIQGLQLKPGEPKKYKSMFHTIATIAREESPLGLFKGLAPGIQRQMVFASLRIGLYEPVRNLYCGGDLSKDPPLIKKILAGMTTGAVGIMIANPTDVVKVRLQGEGNLPAGVPRRYNGSIDAYTKIVATEGVGGLWTGVGPNILRNSVINAAELASYDQIKQTVLNMGLMKDNLFCHFFCGFGAGFCAVIVGSPVDVVKTRMMNANKQAGEGYSGALDCIMKTFRKEGFFAFYNGFTANLMRLAGWNICMFMTLEQIKKFLAPRFDRNYDASH